MLCYPAKAYQSNQSVYWTRYELLVNQLNFVKYEESEYVFIYLYLLYLKALVV